VIVGVSGDGIWSDWLIVGWAHSATHFTVDGGGGRCVLQSYRRPSEVQKLYRFKEVSGVGQSCCSSTSTLGYKQINNDANTW